jgi:hypothetical protein
MPVPVLPAVLRCHERLQGRLGHHVHVHVEAAQDLHGGVSEQIGLEHELGSVAVDAGQLRVAEVLVHEGQGGLVVEVPVGEVGVHRLERRLVRLPVRVASGGVPGPRLDDEARNGAGLAGAGAVVGSRPSDGHE